VKFNPQCHPWSLFVGFLLCLDSHSYCNRISPSVGIWGLLVGKYIPVFPRSLHPLSSGCYPPLNVEAARFSNSLVTTYQFTRHHLPQDYSIYIPASWFSSFWMGVASKLRCRMMKLLVLEPCQIPDRGRWLTKMGNWWNIDVQWKAEMRWCLVGVILSIADSTYYSFWFIFLFRGRKCM
jgi:hypothetical protein